MIDTEFIKSETEHIDTGSGNKRNKPPPGLETGQKDTDPRVTIIYKYQTLIRLIHIGTLQDSEPV